MVIGGGIAGISASIDIGNAGYEVVLVERLPSIGGRMLQLSETFPTLDCAQCTLTPKTVETGQHPRIKLLTYSEVDHVEGKAGDFTVRVREKGRLCGLGEMHGLRPLPAEVSLPKIHPNLIGEWDWARRSIPCRPRPFRISL